MDLNPGIILINETRRQYGVFNVRLYCLRSLVFLFFKSYFLGGDRMIYFSYAIVAAIVVFLSIKVADYVDMIDKTTSLSGAFIGGIMLSAVTSLPELLTTISATAWLGNPGLSLGNILGSNLFNLTILAVLILLSAKIFNKSIISKSHTVTNILLCFIYGTLLLNLSGLLQFEVFSINITSVLIFVFYIFGLKTMASDTDDNSNNEVEDEIVVTLSLNQIIFRFILTSIGLVAFSILITYITDIISAKLNLGAGLAGALFLGIATSLPEVTSCISLVKKKNFNLAVGNILGSNIFNFLVLFIADLLYTKGTIYLFNDMETVNLLIFGAISTPLMLFILNGKNKKSYIYPSIGIMVCYLLFLGL